MKKIDLQTDGNSRKRPKKSKRIIKLIIWLIVLGLLFYFGRGLLGFDKSNPFSGLHLLGDTIKSTDNRVNVLLLGIGGGSHDGGNLTDTILVASYNLKTNQVYFISVPRDLWLPSLKAKANAAYEIGLNQGNGLSFAKTVIGNVVGLPIHYGLRIDFNGFIQAVDAVGGIDVTVENSFDDYNYPITGKEDDLCGYTTKQITYSPEDAQKLNVTPGAQTVFVAPDGTIATNSAQEDMGAKYFTCRYEHISFKKGVTHMDGATALKFVRSRHGTSGEDSDFARSRRQQQVLQALRGKILSLSTLSSPGKISGLINSLGKSVDTDITLKAGAQFYNLIKKMNTTNNFVLDNSKKLGLPGGRTSLLIEPNPKDYGGAYVLVSQDDDFSTIQGFIKKLINGEVDNEGSPSARIRN